MRQPPIHLQPHARHGFTLLELIISVALVLVLMLAITKIFSITSSTIGASQGIAAATRDARAVQAVLARDMGAMASDSPFIWINVSGPASGPGSTGGTFQAFRNADDARSDRDGDPQTIDLNENGTEGESTIPGEIIRNYDVNNRNHRLDQFSFCARDRFSRQTGNSTPNTLVSNMTGSEAWIYYGPLTLPQNNGTFYLNGVSGPKTQPGAGTAQANPNNFYASQWVLGRFAPIMITPPATDIRDSSGTLQEYYPHSAAGNMTPFTFSTASINYTPPVTSSTVVDARYDLVGVSMADARNIVRDYAGLTGWWENVVGSYLEVNPFITKPINAASASHQVPIFIPACSQFIVEFAGDFCTQDGNPASPTYGKAVPGNPTPDGILDYAFNNGQKVIRWYGYPRNTDSVPGISVATVGNDSDVVTVSDFVLPIASSYAVVDITTTPHGVTGLVPFEHASPSASAKTRKTYAVNAAALKYFAAWGPDSIANPAIPRPKMFRITFTIDRPEMAGRSADPQTFEYIYTAP